MPNYYKIQERMISFELKINFKLYMISNVKIGPYIETIICRQVVYIQ